MTYKQIKSELAALRPAVLATAPGSQVRKLNRELGQALRNAAEEADAPVHPEVASHMDAEAMLRGLRRALGYAPCE